MSLRRFRSLLQGLPADGNVGRKLETWESKGWNIQTELMAILAELIDVNTRMFIKANQKKGSPDPKPIKIPRPGSETGETKRRKSTKSEIKRFFGGRIRTRKEAE